MAADGLRPEGHARQAKEKISSARFILQGFSDRLSARAS